MKPVLYYARSCCNRGTKRYEALALARYGTQHIQYSIATTDEKVITKDDRSSQDGSDAATIGRHVQQILPCLESPV
jgi:hypothetical protein